MRREWLIALLLVLACSGCSSSRVPDQETWFPETRITMLNGDYVALDSFRGRTVALLFGP